MSLCSTHELSDGRLQIPFILQKLPHQEKLMLPACDTLSMLHMQLGAGPPVHFHMPCLQPENTLKII